MSFHTRVAATFVHKLTQLSLLPQRLLIHINPSHTHTISRSLYLTNFLSLRSSIWPSMAASDAHNGITIRNAFGSVLAFFILLLIGVLAFSIRLFSVSFSTTPSTSADLLSTSRFNSFSLFFNAIGCF